MLFKFAQDIEVSEGVFIYGGGVKDDGLAQKSVGNELKAISSVFDIVSSNPEFPNFGISLSCRVDFMG